MEPLEKPRKQRKPKITPRVRKAFKAIMANEVAEKPKGLGTILREVGYSNSTALRPTEVTKSASFQYLMERAGITDDLLSIKLKEGLEAHKPYNKDGDTLPDYSTRHKYLDTALKLKGIQDTPGTGNQGLILNQQINQTNLDPNSTEAQEIINNTLDILMKQTLAK